MSTTYDLGCVTCSVRIWVGQNDYLYTSPRERRQLEAFLFEHVGHALAFDKAETLAATDMKRSEGA